MTIGKEEFGQKEKIILNTANYLQIIKNGEDKNALILAT
jgi:hypothetical protein